MLGSAIDKAGISTKTKKVLGCIYKNSGRKKLQVDSAGG